MTIPAENAQPRRVTAGETANRNGGRVVPLRPHPSASARTRAREGTPETATTPRDGDAQAANAAAPAAPAGPGPARRYLQARRAELGGAWDRTWERAEQRRQEKRTARENRTTAPPAPSPVTAADRQRFALLLSLARTFRPPEVWSDPRPSLKAIWHYHAYGEWTGRNTAGRFAGRMYGRFVAIPAAAIGYYLLWIVERPARLVAFTVAAVLLAMTPPGRWLLATATDVALWFLT